MARAKSAAARRMPTFLAIIWYRGSSLACGKVRCTSGGTTTSFGANHSERGHLNASASGGFSGGGFHSTSSSSTGSWKRIDCSARPLMNS
ncbi:MAG: hypothetical protein E6J28_11500 [Chloroflexi bacterium]|nr:MAG: hypothetical protein E6J28_11500 [Chloroflexota bacterium]